MQYKTSPKSFPKERTLAPENLKGFKLLESGSSPLKGGEVLSVEREQHST